MSLQSPELKSILPPPLVPPNCSLQPSVTNAIQSLAARTDLASSRGAVVVRTTASTTKPSSQQQQQQQQSGEPQTPRSVQRHVTLHPVHPLVAYLCEEISASSENSNSSNVNKLLLVVQNVHTGEVLWNRSWNDVASAVYGETNPQKLTAATKSLGTIKRLQFYDASTAYWSGMLLSRNSNSSSTDDSTTLPPPPPPLSSISLLLQTTNRCLMIPLSTHGVAPQLLVSPSVVPPNDIINSPNNSILHLHEGMLQTRPSSNVLLFHNKYILVGCADGTLKCLDNVTSELKSFRGLGSSKDCIVLLLAANPYAAAAASSATTTTFSDNAKRRILALTKKGSLYLMELGINENNGQVEIQPPLARFAGGWPEQPKQQQQLEHELVTYDAHRDWILWLAPASSASASSSLSASAAAAASASASSSSSCVLLVWNLRLLQQEWMKHSSASTFQPDPTLIIPFGSIVQEDYSSSINPASTLAANAAGGAAAGVPTTVLPCLHHPAFGEDTIVCAVVSATGEWRLQGADIAAQSQHQHQSQQQHTTTTVMAAHAIGFPLSEWLAQQAGLQDELENNEIPALLRITAICTQPLGQSPTVVVTTQLGLVVLDCSSTGPMVGARHLHFGAGLGSMGKSILSIHHSNVVYGSLDNVLVVANNNPVGRMEAKNCVPVYESPPAMHLPAEVHKRPFRLAPTFIPSPSGLYLCLFWPSEFRYEILHTASLLQKVGQHRGAAGITTLRNPLVASGTGICSFAWVGDDDVYAVLHAAGLMEEATAMLVSSMGVSSSMALEGAAGGVGLTHIGKSAMNVANLAQSATKAATSATLSATKLATSATLSATKAATSATMSATKAATSSATKAVRSSVTKGVKKASFGLFGKKQKKGTDGSIMDMTEDDTSEAPSISTLQTPTEPLPAFSTPRGGGARAGTIRQYVELRCLVAVESQDSALGGSIAAATSNGLGELSLRGGNRNPPAKLFGGPVLCVASRSEGGEKGHAQFYTRRQDEQANDASAYVSSGPTLPFPDLCAWDDDGRLCAVVVQNRVAVYLSNIPDFVLLGTVRIASTSEITSVKFVHGVLFCCTWNSVHCVFLGDLEGGICKIDSYVLASSVVPMIPLKAVNGEYSSLTPPVVPLPLVQPAVLGYQSGSVMISTARGVHAIPLNHPLLRIGTLMSAGQVDRAEKWFDAVPDENHEALAAFVERRGHPELALQLRGLSLETIVDMSMRHGYVGRLEEVVEDYGVKGLRAIDMGRGVTSSIFGPERITQSVVVCVGAYLLAHGRVELTRRLATELLRSGEDGKKDALFLASLLLSADEADATRLMSRAVEEDGNTCDWPVGEYVRNHVLSPRND